MYWIDKAILLATTIVLVQSQSPLNGRPSSSSVGLPISIPPSWRPPRPLPTQSGSVPTIVAMEALQNAKKPLSTKPDTFTPVGRSGVAWEGQQSATYETPSSQMTIGEQILQQQRQKQKQQQEQQQQQVDIFGLPIPQSDPFDLFGPAPDPFGSLFSSSPRSDPFFGGFGGATTVRTPSLLGSSPNPLGGEPGGGLGAGGLLRNLLLLRLLGGGADAPDPAPRRPGQPAQPRQLSPLEELLRLEQRQSRRQMQMERMRNRQHPLSRGRHFPPQTTPPFAPQPSRDWQPGPPRAAQPSRDWQPGPPETLQPRPRPQMQSMVAPPSSTQLSHRPSRTRSQGSAHPEVLDRRNTIRPTRPPRPTPTNPPQRPEPVEREGARRGQGGPKGPAGNQRQRQQQPQQAGVTRGPVDPWRPTPPQQTTPGYPVQQYTQPPYHPPPLQRAPPAPRGSGFQGQARGQQRLGPNAVPRNIPQLMGNRQFQRSLRTSRPVPAAVAAAAASGGNAADIRADRADLMADHMDNMQSMNPLQRLLNPGLGGMPGMPGMGGLGGLGGGLGRGLGSGLGRGLGGLGGAAGGLGRLSALSGLLGGGGGGGLMTLALLGGGGGLGLDLEHRRRPPLNNLLVASFRSQSRHRRATLHHGNDPGSPHSHSAHWHPPKPPSTDKELTGRRRPPPPPPKRRQSVKTERHTIVPETSTSNGGNHLHFSMASKSSVNQGNARMEASQAQREQTVKNNNNNNNGQPSVPNEHGRFSDIGSKIRKSLWPTQDKKTNVVNHGLPRMEATKPAAPAHTAQEHGEVLSNINVNSIDTQALLNNVRAETQGTNGGSKGGATGEHAVGHSAGGEGAHGHGTTTHGSEGHIPLDHPPLDLGTGHGPIVDGEPQLGHFGHVDPILLLDHAPLDIGLQGLGAEATAANHGAGEQIPLDHAPLDLGHGLNAHADHISGNQMPLEHHGFEHNTFNSLNHISLDHGMEFTTPAEIAAPSASGHQPALSHIADSAHGDLHAAPIVNAVGAKEELIPRIAESSHVHQRINQVTSATPTASDPQPIQQQGINHVSPVSNAGPAVNSANAAQDNAKFEVKFMSMFDAWFQERFGATNPPAPPTTTTAIPTTPAPTTTTTTTTTTPPPVTPRKVLIFRNGDANAHNTRVMRLRPVMPNTNSAVRPSFNLRERIMSPSGSRFGLPVVFGPRNGPQPPPRVWFTVQPPPPTAAPVQSVQDVSSRQPRRPPQPPREISAHVSPPRQQSAAVHHALQIPKSVPMPPVASPVTPVASTSPILPVASPAIKSEPSALNKNDLYREFMNMFKKEFTAQPGTSGSGAGNGNSAPHIHVHLMSEPGDANPSAGHSVSASVGTHAAPKHVVRTETVSISSSVHEIHGEVPAGHAEQHEAGVNPGLAHGTSGVSVPAHSVNPEAGTEQATDTAIVNTAGGRAVRIETAEHLSPVRSEQPNPAPEHGHVTHAEAAGHEEGVPTHIAHGPPTHDPVATHIAHNSPTQDTVATHIAQAPVPTHIAHSWPTQDPVATHIAQSAPAHTETVHAAASPTGSAGSLPAEVVATGTAGHVIPAQTPPIVEAVNVPAVPTPTQPMVQTTPIVTPATPIKPTTVPTPRKRHRPVVTTPPTTPRPMIDPDYLADINEARTYQGLAPLQPYQVDLRGNILPQYRRRMNSRMVLQQSSFQYPERNSHNHARTNDVRHRHRLAHMEVGGAMTPELHRAIHSILRNSQARKTLFGGGVRRNSFTARNVDPDLMADLMEAQGRVPMFR